MREKILKLSCLMLVIAVLVGVLASCNFELPNGVLGGGNTDNGTDGNGNNGTNGNENNGTGGNESGTHGGTEGDSGADDNTPTLPDAHSHDWTSNPYTGIAKEDFYRSYTEACCYLDATYRTELYLMSGDISDQDQAPTRADYMPKSDGKNVKNSSHLYSADKNTYYVTDGNGNVVDMVFRGAAYVTLEDVAAYVYAFGNIPANYTTAKKGTPSTDPWGKYLRLNNSAFSGSTTKYPYEPAFPRISGCGGDLSYYEIDIGTTGTDCDPEDYRPEIYNNGSRITRGAARIVYARFDKRDNVVANTEAERFVFYTYNHYNDFEEYLNYRGGWGDMFGNITGGGKISDKYNCNPTPYVTVAILPLVGIKE